MNNWWRIITEYSRRDQLSFMYVLSKSEVECTQMYPESARFRDGFSFNDHNRRFCSGLFYDTGKSFNGKELLFNDFILTGKNTFEVSFSFREFISLKEVKFSPHLQCFSEIKINRVIVSGITGQKEISISGIETNGSYNKNNYFMFNLYDPYCTIQISEKIKKIAIKGEMNIYQSANEVNEFLYKFYKKNPMSLLVWLGKQIIKQLLGKRITRFLKKG